MFFWSSFPFVRYLFYLIAGIVAGYARAPSGFEPWPLIAALTVLYLILHVYRKRLKRATLLQGIVAGLMIALLGFGRVEDRQQLLQGGRAYADTTAWWLVEAREDATFTPKTAKVQLNLLAVQEAGAWTKQEGRILLYIRKEGLQSLPRYGDRLLLRARLQEVPKPLNPNTFNYRQYLETQGICCQAFVRAEDLQFIHTEDKTGIQALAMQIRRWASRQVQEHITGRQEAGIVNALVLGYRETLDEEITQAYATAGAMHVLAVSGLHVGFIFLFLKFIFRSWRRRKGYKWVAFAISLLILWAYALVTGLSPSVLRAVWMFSLLDAALLLKRRAGIYNTLAVAAFCMLVYNPDMLRMVGFQLSYLALLGIVYLQPRIAAWYKGDNRVVNWLWKLTSVSIAAQIATFPLGLYYFRQFPTYFFLSNIAVIPAASLVLGFGFLMLLLSLFSAAAAGIIGSGLYYLMKVVNGFIFLIDRLPYSKLTGILSEYQLALLLLFIIGLLLFLHSKRFTASVLTTMLGLTLLGSFFYERYHHRQQRKFILYHQPGQSAVHLIAGEADYLWAAQEPDEGMLRFTIEPNRQAGGILPAKVRQENEPSFKPAMQDVGPYTLLVWEGLRMAYLRQPLRANVLPGKPIELDYVILAHNSVQDLALLQQYFRPKMILIDGSNQFYLQKRLQQEAEILNLPCHLTAEAGAFELNL